MIHHGKREEVCHGRSDRPSWGLRCSGIAAASPLGRGRWPGPAVAGTGGYLCRELSERGSGGRWGWVANGAGLGAAVQRRGAKQVGNGQGAGKPAASRRSRARGAAPGRRGRPDAGDPRGGAVAHRRSDAMAVGGVPALGVKADNEPRVARPGVSQAHGAAAPLCQGRGRRGGI